MSTYDCSVEHARKNIYAIRWYSKFKEHVGQEVFTVESNDVAVALRKVKRNHMEKIANQRASITPDDLPDPHANLPTNNLSVKDLDRLMTYLLSSRNDWSDISIPVLWGISGFLRGDTVRRSTWQDITLDHSHGAERRGQLATSINWILREGIYNHKVKLTRNRIVGCWRHREVFHCPIGILAMSFVCRLSEMGRTLSFCRAEHREANFWRNIPIVSYKTYGPQYDTSRRILAHLNISCSKVTHYKRTGIDYGGTAGLSRAQLGSHAKMSTNNVDNRYVNDL